MSRISLHVMALQPSPVWRLSLLKQRLAEWRVNVRSRRELMGLSNRCLQDIGVSRCTAEFEASKPFWIA